MAANTINNPELRIAIEERAQKVLVLRRAGATERQIAAQLGVALKTVQNDLDRILTRTAKRNDGHADRLRALQRERLEDQIRKINNRMTPYNPADPNDDPKLKRIDFETGSRLLLSYIDREIKLDGLDAPTKIDVTEANQLVQLIIAMGGNPQRLFKVIHDLISTPGIGIGLLADNVENTDDQAEAYIKGEILNESIDVDH